MTNEVKSAIRGVEIEVRTPNLVDSDEFYANFLKELYNSEFEDTAKKYDPHEDIYKIIHKNKNYFLKVKRNTVIDVDSEEQAISFNLRSENLEDEVIKLVQEIAKKTAIDMLA